MTISDCLLFYVYKCLSLCQGLPVSHTNYMHYVLQALCFSIFLCIFLISDVYKCFSLCNRPTVSLTNEMQYVLQTLGFSMYISVWACVRPPVSQMNQMQYVLQALCILFGLNLYHVTYYYVISTNYIRCMCDINIFIAYTCIYLTSHSQGWSLQTGLTEPPICTSITLTSLKKL